MKKSVKKKRQKICLSILIILILLLIGFFMFYYSINSKITGDAVLTKQFEINSDYKIPTGFKPVVGYYHQTNGEIHLWDYNGKLIVYSTTGLKLLWEEITTPGTWKTWREVDRGYLQYGLGLPSSFKPVVEYYYNNQIHLWDSSGALYVYDGSKWSLKSKSNSFFSGLPTGFKPQTGYIFYSQIHLWDTNGKLWVYSGTKWLDKTSEQVSKGLTSGFRPTEGFYHSLSGGRINLFDSSGKMAIYNPSTGKWNMKSVDEVSTMGLIGRTSPSASLFDKTNSNSLIFYTSTNNVYSSISSSTPVCTGTCSVNGQTACVGDKIKTCTKAINGCFYWSTAVNCPTGKVCKSSTGRCELKDVTTPICTSNCNFASQTACVGDKIKTCTKNINGCFYWSTAVNCPLSQKCNSTTNLCEFFCTNTCDYQGQKMCEGIRVKICIKDIYGCLKWKTINCPTGQSCNLATDTCEPIGDIESPNKQFEKITLQTFPTGFKPIVGYYHPFGGGRINLFDANGGLLVYNYNSKQWLQRTGSQTSLGLPSDFKPVVGYYFQNIGEIHLWDSSGVLYTYDGRFWAKKSKDDSFFKGFPTGFKPIVGYYHPFGGGRINLFDANGKMLVYNPADGIWYDRTGSQTSLGLPSDFKPVEGYYHLLGGGRINLFDASGRLAVYNSKTQKWNLLSTSDVEKIGLPKGIYPSLGFFDEVNSKVLLFYEVNKASNADIYGSISINTNSQSIPEDASNYLKIRLIYGSDLMTVESIEKATLNQYETFVDGQVSSEKDNEGNYVEEYKAVFYDDKGIFLKQYSFNFGVFSILSNPPEYCWTNYNGEWVIDNTKCDLRPREEILINCKIDYNDKSYRPMKFSVFRRSDNKLVASASLDGRC